MSCPLCNIQRLIAQSVDLIRPSFSVDAESFKAFARSLPNGINSPFGKLLLINDVVDFDMCWAYNFADPWGNNFELNCYEYERIRAELTEADGVEPVRYWPRDLYERFQI